MAVATKPDTTGVSSGIRIAFGLFVAISLGIFTFLWESQIIGNGSSVLGSVVALPILAIALGYITDCIVQQISCGKVAWSDQFKKALTIPIPFWCTFVALYFLPIMRWPIEGLVQGTTPLIRHGLSSAFYMFWVALYTQSLHISLAQLC